MALKQDNSSGYEALRTRAALVERTRSGWLVLTGADRRSYLQGLLTNDIEALTPGTGCYAAMLTAQGRMMTDMRVFELGDAVLMEVPVEMTRSIREHLDRFIFSEDVTVEDVSAARVAFGLYGPQALQVLQIAGMEGSASAPLLGVSRVRIAAADALLIRSDATGVGGFDIVTASGSAPAIRGALTAAGAVAASDADAEIVRVESGRPRFGADMDTETIPLEAGLEERAISRSKGCYVGQEVIVRVQDRGQGRVARKLVALTFNAGDVPAAGTTIRSGEREIGRITSSVWSPSLQRPVALGYVHRDFTADGTHVFAGDTEGVVTAPPLVPAVR